MIVYRADERREPTAAVLDRLSQAATPRDLLIAFGEFESAAADALCPERDAELPATRALRDIAEDLGSGLYAGQMTLPAALAVQLPQELRTTVPEGYAYYALYPEAYMKAAAEFHENNTPRACVVVGIRSIGTSLSAAVAGTLQRLGCETRSYTVRPRGHPFDRRIAAAGGLEAELRARRDWWFAVVDEGPGLSGSSFAAVAAWLSGLGVPDERIVLFPSSEPDGSAFVSASARERWQRHRKYTTPFEAVWRPPWPGIEDLSGGAWRGLLYGSEGEYPAVSPQHERRKYLRNGRDPVLLKFAGLGRYGTAKLRLATELASAGFCPAVEGLYDGFLATRFEPGRPLTRRDVCTALLDRIADYLAFRKRSFPAPRGAGFDELIEMARINTREALGDERIADRLQRLHSAVAHAGAVKIDGRMLPHEWLETAQNYVKTDAVDHFEDHFYPGCQDIAWDLAGCAIEFGLGPEAEAYLTATYSRCAADEGIANRILFYKGVYAAYRLGYARMAAASLAGCVEAERFQRLASYYGAVSLSQMDASEQDFIAS